MNPAACSLKGKHFPQAINLKHHLGHVIKALELIKVSFYIAILFLIRVYLHFHIQFILSSWRSHFLSRSHDCHLIITPGYLVQDTIKHRDFFLLLKPDQMFARLQHRCGRLEAVDGGV